MVITGILLYFVDDNYLSSLKENWQIKLPRTFNQLVQYTLATDDSEKKVLYTMLNYENKRRAKSLNKMKWTKEKSKIVEEEWEQILDTTQYKETLNLDFENNYWYYRDEKDSSQLLIIYMLEKNIVYIIETT